MDIDILADKIGKMRKELTDIEVNGIAIDIAESTDGMSKSETIEFILENFNFTEKQAKELTKAL